MHNQQQARPALMLPPEFEGDVDNSGDVSARISALPPPSQWLRDFGKDQSLAPLADAELGEELEFWNAPPAYPSTSPESPSLPPPVLVAPRSAARVWIARGLFLAVFGSALGLLVSELCRLLLQRAT